MIQDRGSALQIGQPFQGNAKKEDNTSNIRNNLIRATGFLNSSVNNQPEQCILQSSGAVCSTILPSHHPLWIAFRQLVPILSFPSSNFGHWDRQGTEGEQIEGFLWAFFLGGGALFFK